MKPFFCFFESNAAGWKCLTAGTVALAYAVTAISIVHGERTAVGGGFITLRGMGAWLATFPISMPFELLGHKLDYRSNWQMGGAIVTCSAIVFGLSYAIAKGAAFITDWIGSH